MQPSYCLHSSLPLYAMSVLTALLATTSFVEAKRPQPVHHLEELRAKLQSQIATRQLTTSRVAMMIRALASPPPAPTKAGLGGQLYGDLNLSLKRNQSCASCHSLSPAINELTGRPQGTPGFADSQNVRDSSPVSKGSVAGQFGGLNAPSVGYAAFSPRFYWNAVEGLYIGGQFWNGRAANLAEQAAGPFLNPKEMAMPSKWATVTRLKENESYRSAFQSVFGINLNAITSNELAPSSAVPPPGVLAAYDAMTQAIAEFEKQPQFNRFTSKFDFYLAGVTTLTAQEERGLNAFNGTKALCSACHISDPGIAPDGNVLPPLFTDFTYDNIGVPRNVRIPGNPEPDPGLGGRPDIQARSPDTEVGKHKVMSLRNIAVTAPYAHNGVFTTLEQAVHFYSTRDVLGTVASNASSGFGITGWPAPEFPATINVDELGNLQLTPTEESDIVAFLKTLTDNYPETGGDPNVPPGTPSPFADMPFPPFP